MGYLAVGIIKIMGLLSFPAAQRLGRLIGWSLWVRKTRSREVAKLNLAMCYPDMSEQERLAMVKETLLHGSTLR